MAQVLISEEVLRDKLKGKFPPQKIDALVDEYIEAASAELPDGAAIAELAQRKSPADLYRVSFALTPDQYEALSSYFGEAERPGTVLAKKAVEELIKQAAL